jgi:uncharacterized membrane protein YhaH (DUF805 family)
VSFLYALFLLAVSAAMESRRFLKDADKRVWYNKKVKVLYFPDFIIFIRHCKAICCLFVHIYHMIRPQFQRSNIDCRRPPWHWCGLLLTTCGFMAG